MTRSRARFATILVAVAGAGMGGLSYMQEQRVDRDYDEKPKKQKFGRGNDRSELHRRLDQRQKALFGVRDKVMARKAAR